MIYMKRDIRYFLDDLLLFYHIIWMIYLFYYKVFYSFLLEHKIKLFFNYFLLFLFMEINIKVLIVFFAMFETFFLYY